MAMDFLDVVKEKLTTATRTAAKKSSEIVEITKLKASISDELSTVNKTLRSMGQALYEAYKTGEETDFSLEETCAELDEAYARIEELQARVAELKNTKICPTCKKEMERDAIFCSVCGERF